MRNTSSCLYLHFMQLYKGSRCSLCLEQRCLHFLTLACHLWSQIKPTLQLWTPCLSWPVIKAHVRSRNQIVTKAANLFTLGTKLIVDFWSLIWNTEKQYQVRYTKFDVSEGREVDILLKTLQNCSVDLRRRNTVFRFFKQLNVRGTAWNPGDLDPSVSFALVNHEVS